MAGRTKKKVEYQVYYTMLSDTSDAKGGAAAGKSASQVKFAWLGSKAAYPDDIAKQLGVVAAQDNEPGLVFGMNNPRPARVYINIKTEKGSKAYFVFANPNKIASLLIKSSLRGKNYREGKITTVTLPKSSTRPTRSKSSSKTSGNNNKLPKRTLPKKNNKIQK